MRVRTNRTYRQAKQSRFDERPRPRTDQKRDLRFAAKKQSVTYPHFLADFWGVYWYSPTAKEQIAAFSPLIYCSTHHLIYWSRAARGFLPRNRKKSNFLPTINDSPDSFSPLLLNSSAVLAQRLMLPRIASSHICFRAHASLDQGRMSQHICQPTRQSADSFFPVRRSFSDRHSLSSDPAAEGSHNWSATASTHHQQTLSVGLAPAEARLLSYKRSHPPQKTK